MSRGTRNTAVVIAAMIMASATPASALVSVTEEETHCVVEVVGQEPSGEFIVTEPTCYSTFPQAVAAMSDGVLRLPPDSTGVLAFGDEGLATTLSSFTLGIHYDGLGGSGSSISVVGSSCTGGWWNTPSSWRNRISSTYNGCNQLRHYDNPNKSGSYETTWGSGSTDNLGPLNNRTESVAYY